MRLPHFRDLAVLNAPAFNLSRTALGTTTLFLTSAAAAPGALADTGLQGQSDASAAEPEEIVVTGTRSVVNEKLGGDIEDVPQSINVITAKTLSEQAVTNLQDALKNVPGITLNAGEGAARGDTVNLRGFPAFNDFFLDGIRDAGVYTRDAFDLETLEVLKGPSAILFGRGSTGGVINQVTKAPTMSGFEDAALQFGTNSQIRATGDVDMAIGPAAAVRVNGMIERSEVTDRDNVFNRRWGIAPAFALGLGEDDSLNFSYLHQQENDRPDVGVPFVNGAPPPIPRNLDYGLLSDRFKSSVDLGTLRLEHRFSDDFSLTNTSRIAVYDYENHRSSPNFGTTPPGPTTPISSILVGRDDPASSGPQEIMTDQLDFNAHFDTAGFKHDLITGIELSRETLDIGRYLNPFNSNNNWIPRVPLLNPNPGQTLPQPLPITSLQRTKADGMAAYLEDTIHLTDEIKLIGGVRFDRFVATFNQYTVATHASLNLAHTDNVTSPRAALVWEPTEYQHYYFSYGTSFDPSAEALSLSSKTANLGPVKAHSLEAGAKTDWLDGKLSLTGAIFQIEVDNAQTNDPENPNVVVLAGDQRVNGLELGASGHLTENWEILAGYTYLDAKTISSNTAGATGKFLMNTARNAVNLWTEYYVDDHWEVGTGGNFLGRRYGDLQNTASIPSYFIWNGMVAYRIDEHYDVQMNVTNLLDRAYYDNAYYTSASENHITPGAGRTFTFVAHAHF